MLDYVETSICTLCKRGQKYYKLIGEPARLWNNTRWFSGILHIVFRIECNLADSEIANPWETGLKNARVPIGLNDQKKRERSSPKDCLVPFKARRGKHVGDRCIVTRTERTRSRSRASTKRTKRTPQSAQLVPRHSFRAHERSALSSVVLLAPSLAHICYSLPIIRFLPTAGWTRTVSRSHASATRLRAVQKPPSCTLCACRSEVVSYNTHTRASR